MMYKLARKVVFNRYNIFLTGAKGCGKSFLAHSLGYFIKTHHVFKQGIYFIKLKKMKPEMDLFTYLQIYFGKQFNQNNFYQFFDDKEMLLIFDDIEVLLCGPHKWAQDAKMLFRILKSYKNSIVNIFIYQNERVNQHVDPQNDPKFSFLDPDFFENANIYTMRDVQPLDPD